MLRIQENGNAHPMSRHYYQETCKQFKQAGSYASPAGNLLAKTAPLSNQRKVGRIHSKKLIVMENEFYSSFHGIFESEQQRVFTFVSSAHNTLTSSRKKKHEAIPSHYCTY